MGRRSSLLFNCGESSVFAAGPRMPRLYSNDTEAVCRWSLAELPQMFVAVHCFYSAASVECRTYSRPAAWLLLHVAVRHRPVQRRCAGSCLAISVMQCWICNEVDCNIQSQHEETTRRSVPRRDIPIHRWVLCSCSVLWDWNCLHARSPNYARCIRHRWKRILAVHLRSSVYRCLLKNIQLQCISYMRILKAVKISDISMFFVGNLQDNLIRVTMPTS